MYVVVDFLEAKREHVASLRAALLLLARHSLEHEPGCRQFDVAAHPLEPVSFLSYELYDDEAGWRLHLESEHMQWFKEQAAEWVASKRALSYELISGHGLA